MFRYIITLALLVLASCSALGSGADSREADLERREAAVAVARVETMAQKAINDADGSRLANVLTADQVEALRIEAALIAEEIIAYQDKGLNPAGLESKLAAIETQYADHAEAVVWLSDGVIVLGEDVDLLRNGLLYVHEVQGSWKEAHRQALEAVRLERRRRNLDDQKVSG